MLSCPLTVKLRRGYNDGADVAHTILPQLAEWGAAGATLHGRSREQRQDRHAPATLILASSFVKKFYAYKVYVKFALAFGIGLLSYLLIDVTCN